MRRNFLLAVLSTFGWFALFPSRGKTTPNSLPRVEELGAYERTIMATCRVTHSSRSTGSGVCYREDNTHIWILSAGHVVKKEKRIRLEFYSNKVDDYFRKSPVIYGQVVWAVDDDASGDIYRDLSVIKVAKKDFNDYPLPLIAAFENPKVPLFPYRGFISSGCAHAYSPTTIIGFVKQVARNNTFSMIPGTAPGRSGSAIFDITGRKVLGIILRTNTAINVKKIYEVTGWEVPQR